MNDLFKTTKQKVIEDGTNACYKLMVTFLRFKLAPEETYTYDDLHQFMDRRLERTYYRIKYEI
jgi:hypothetical protein